MRAVLVSGEPGDFSVHVNEPAVRHVTPGDVRDFAYLLNRLLMEPTAENAAWLAEHFVRTIGFRCAEATSRALVDYLMEAG